MDRYSCDGASLSIVVEEGESVDVAGSGATTLAIRAMTSVIKGGTNGVEGGGFSTSPELIVEESFHEARVINCYIQKPL
ncbi:hypothetical protein Tco_0705804 [Tanacetum coccineum]|uniref:Uncharacterized protein n=1 Tax=Tanacetum coccineum TaxID=301880 RepID=A0ABQ4Y7M1_9ASTR